MAGLTPFQTVGPYLAIGLRAGSSSPAVPEGGRRIVVCGRLLDGEGRGIPDGALEWWHAALPAFQRVLVDDDGAFAVDTLAPGVTPGPEGRDQAPHFAVRVLGRGILTQYITRMYLADEPHNASDAVLSLVPDTRRHTLLATPSGPDAYMFDIVVQGENETVFFDV